MLKFKFAMYAFFMILAVGIPSAIIATFALCELYNAKTPEHAVMTNFCNVMFFSLLIIIVVCSYHLFRRPFKIAIKKIGKLFKAASLILVPLAIWLCCAAINNDPLVVWLNIFEIILALIIPTLIVWYFFIPILYTKKVAEYYSATYPDKVLRFLYIFPLIIGIFGACFLLVSEDIGAVIINIALLFPFFAIPIHLITRITLACINLKE